MRLFCSVLFCLMLVLVFLVGCGGVPEKRNAELVVEYEDAERDACPED